MKLEHMSAVLLGVGALIAGFAGCGDDSTTGAGGAGSTTTTTTTTSTGGPSSTTGSGMADPFLGIECTGDTDCGDQGVCITSTDDDGRLGGGPARGYCSRSCNTDSDCPGPGIPLCWKDANGEGRCFLGCETGDPPLEFVNSPLDINKCRAREDVRCDTVEGVNVCVPTCGSDGECDGGRKCDPRLRVCVTNPNTGLPTGDECMQGGTDPCAGICVNFSIVSMCTNYCTVGGDIMWADCGGLDKGLCAYTATNPVGAGDVGFCAKACLKHDDCLNPNLWCFGIGNLTGSVIPNGFCFGGADPCPNGQANCTDPNDVCTNTAYGPFCLDPQFPLNAGAGGGGGGGVGGAGGGGVGGAGGGMGGAGGN